MTTKRITKLNELDFSPGIRASDINENFELLKRWIEEERLRVSGWGIVEGFELSKNLDNFTISVGEGILIDKNGAHLEIPSKIFDGFELDHEYGLRPRATNIEETVTVSESGLVKLQYPIYSEDTTRPEFTYKIVYYESGRLPSDLEIIDEDSKNPLTRNDVDTIAASEIKLMSGFAGKQITVKYKYANDRIDGIFINKAGINDKNQPIYRYELGYGTDTPTCNTDEYIIGYAYWHVDKQIDVEFITDDRSYRQVYVDKNGELYLMGKPYSGYRFIFFGTKEEVSSRPLVNDLWYDVEENILKIWRKDLDTDEFRWFPVNDLARFTRETKIYGIEDNPDDLQTFIFEDSADKNLVFVPNKNQLTVIIDQVVLMDDQIIELYNKEADKNAASGYGFKLVEPLDEPRVVEVRVEHSANTQNYTQDLFSKVASFVDEGILNTLTSDLPAKFYRLPNKYETQKCELELWLNGKKLIKGTDFYEAKEAEDGSLNTVAARETSSVSSYVYIDLPITIDDTVTYRITRFMTTYSNFNSELEPIRKSIEENHEFAETHIEALEENLENLDAISTNNFNSIERDISSIQESYRKISTKIVQSDLEEKLTAKIIHPIAHFTRNAYNPEPIDGKLSDYISIIWVSGEERKPLVYNLDYRISEDEGQLEIELSDLWESTSAKLYITRISMSED